MRGEEFDLLVIGGGIVGAGIAREARARGLSVALVDRGDWGSGTSGRTSRLVHGGLRYLEHGALGLVRTALRERSALLAAAPHLVRPLRFLAPAWGDERYGLTTIGLAVSGYNLLAGRHGLGPGSRLGPLELSSAEPAVRRDRLQGAVGYFDARTDDARLVLTLVRTAWLAGAVAVNYMAADALLHQGGVVCGARLVDQLSGETCEARARVVINACGPWIHETAGLDGEKRSFLRLTRGAHILVPRLTREAILLPSRDGRVVFVLPAGGGSIVGTTDVDHQGSLDQVAASEEDVAFLLAEVQRNLPHAGLTRDKVRAAWAALRPLVAGEGAPGGLSREHRVEQGRSGLLSVYGGKLTTFRVVAADVVAQAIRALGRGVVGRPAAPFALDGGDIPDLVGFTGAMARELGARFQAPVEQSERLVGRYGTRTSGVARLAEHEPGLFARLCPHHPYLAVEAAYAAHDEMAMTLSDFLFRRARIAHGPCRGEDCAGAAAEAMAVQNGWSKARRVDEVAAYLDEVRRLVHVQPAVR